LLLLLLALPALALAALALLLASALAGRPARVLEFRPRVRWQRTGEYDDVGLHGGAEKQTYGVLHFRTRREDGGRESGAQAPLVAFLERTELDRLPALLSVLKGDLRLVGVRPLTPAEADHLVEEWQRLPYEGPAGFTGLWYVRANGADLDEIVATDAYYTATRSLLEDLHVLLSTPAAWIAGWARTPRARSKPQWRTWRSNLQRRIPSLAWRRQARMPETDPSNGTRP
jgi:hypothetical protein